MKLIKYLTESFRSRVSGLNAVILPGTNDKYEIKIFRGNDKNPAYVFDVGDVDWKKSRD